MEPLRKSVIALAIAICTIAFAAAANASGPRACDVEGNCPTPVSSASPDVNDRDDDIPAREDFGNYVSCDTRVPEGVPCCDRGSSEPRDSVCCDTSGPTPDCSRVKPAATTSAYPERIPTTESSMTTPMSTDPPSMPTQLPATGTAEVSMIFGTIALFGLYLIARKSIATYRRRLSEMKSDPNWEGNRQF